MKNTCSFLFILIVLCVYSLSSSAEITNSNSDPSTNINISTDPGSESASNPPADETNDSAANSDKNKTLESNTDKTTKPVSKYNFATIVSMKNRTGLTCTVKVKTDKVRKYYIYKQTGQPEDSKFLESHGCSTCALATVLNSIGGYNYTPAYIHKKLIPKKLGKKYTMPIKLYGIHKILKKYKIYSKFVPRFTKVNAKKDITKWLKRGGMVIVTVNSGSDNRWTSKHHSFVLLGIKENGVVIVGDSAQVNFQGNRRIKKARLDNIVKYMIPCTSSRYTYCWPGTSTAGGYILTGDVKR